MNGRDTMERGKSAPVSNYSRTPADVWDDRWDELDGARLRGEAREKDLLLYKVSAAPERAWPAV